jgi:hypothetical protein
MEAFSVGVPPFLAKDSTLKTVVASAKLIITAVDVVIRIPTSWVVVALRE